MIEVMSSHLAHRPTLYEENVLPGGLLLSKLQGATQLSNLQEELNAPQKGD